MANMDWGASKSGTVIAVDRCPICGEDVDDNFCVWLEIWDMGYGILDEVSWLRWGENVGAKVETIDFEAERWRVLYLSNGVV